MKIIDLNGKEMEVTNLDLAVMQADDYRHYATPIRHLWKQMSGYKPIGMTSTKNY